MYHFIILKGKIKTTFIAVVVQIVSTKKKGNYQQIFIISRRKPINKSKNNTIRY